MDVQNFMFKENKGNQLNHELKAEAKQVFRKSVYLQGTLKQNLHIEFYNSLISLYLEKRCLIYYAARMDRFRMLGLVFENH